jgi:hypothetical protein
MTVMPQTSTSSEPLYLTNNAPRRAWWTFDWDVGELGEQSWQGNENRFQIRALNLAMQGCCLYSFLRRYIAILKFFKIGWRGKQ